MASVRIRTATATHRRLSHAAAPELWYAPHMRSAIWIGIFIGSTIGGDDMLSYSGVLFSDIGAFVGLWLGSRAA
jgi:hypothetical protein